MADAAAQVREPTEADTSQVDDLAGRDPADAPFARSIAVLVGIDQYVHLRHLGTAVADARAVADVVARLHGFEITVLENRDADQVGIEAAIDELRRRVSPRDRVLFYFAGHGFAETDEHDNLRGFFAPHDARRDDETTLLSMRDVRDRLVDLPAAHVLLVADCCFAGALDLMTRDVGVRVPMPLERYQRYVRDRARQFLGSAAHNERALDIVAGRPVGDRGTTADGHSPFAQALLAALRGEADLNSDGLITIRELELFVEDYFASLELQRQVRTQRPVLRSLDRAALGEYVFFHPGRPLVLLPAVELCAKNNPFRGLLPFTTGDQALFFGRSALSSKLTEYVNQQPAVLVLGASGSGKSSVLAAGLIPRWIAAHSDDEICGPLRPAEALSASDLARQAPALIVIDQLEELWTRAIDADARGRFFDWLRKCQAAGAKIVCALRADFETSLEQDIVARPLSFGRFLVPPPSRAELREMVVGPCDAKALFFEPPSLVDRLVEDTAQVAGGLPLLSLALSELYRARVKRGGFDRTLLAIDYHGVLGALGHSLSDLDAQYRSAKDGESLSRVLRWVLVRMVDTSDPEPTGRRIARAEIKLPMPGDTERAERIIADLEQRRLVVSDLDHQRHRVVGPAHDALVRSWSVLQTWIKEEDNRDGGLALQRRLRDWTKGNGALWTGRQLDVACDLIGTSAPLNQDELVFLHTSRRAQRRRRRVLAGLAIVAAVLIVGAAMIARWQRQRALTNLDTANHNLARAFADHARKSVQERDYLSARLMFARSLVLTHDDAVLESLIGVWSSGELTWRIAGGDTPGCRKLAIPSASKLAVVGGPDGSLVAHRLDTGQVVWRRELGGSIAAVVASRDGATVAAGGSLGKVVVVSTRDGTVVSEVTLQSHRGAAEISSLALSESAELLGVGTESHGVELHDLRNRGDGKPVWGASAHEEYTGGVAFTHDGRSLLWTAFGYLWITNVEEHNGEHETSRLIVARDGWAVAAHPKHLLFAFTDRRIGITLLDPRRGPFGRLSQHDGEITALKFDASGDTLVSAGADGRVLLWDTSTDNSFATLLWSSPSQGQRICDASEEAGVAVFGTADGAVSAYRRPMARTEILKTPDELNESASDADHDNARSASPLELGRQSGRYDNGIKEIVTTPGGALATISQNGTVRFWERPGRATFVDTPASLEAPFVMLSPELDAIAMISLNRTKFSLRRWGDGAAALEYAAPPGERLFHLVVASHGGRVLVAGSTGMLRLFDSESKELSWSRDVGMSDITKLAMSADARVYAVASGTTLLVARADDGVELIRTRLASSVRDIVVTDDYVGAITDEAASTWDLRSFEQRTLRSGGNRLAISRDARWLAVGGNDAKVELWELPRMVLRSRVRIPAFNASVTALAFTASTDRLLVGGSEAKVYSVDARQIVELVDMDPTVRFQRAERETGYLIRGAEVVPRAYQNTASIGGESSR